MNRRKVLLTGILIAGLAAASFSSNSCAIETFRSPLIQTQEVLEERVKTKPLLVGIEGAFVSGYVIHNLTAKIAYQLGLAQSADKSNYKKHLMYIEKVHENGNKIILLGYSAGCDAVRKLAEDCEKRNINIDLMIFLDPTYLAWLPPKKISRNVRKVICYKSNNDGLIEGRALERKDFESQETSFENYKLKKTDHWNLPKNKELFEKLEQDIKEKIEE